MNKKPTPLEALEKIANIEMKEQYKADKGGFVYRVVNDECPKEFKVIKNALEDAEKNKKAFEILKGKNIDPTRIKCAENVDAYNYSIYPINKTVGIELLPKITQEEYALLKEILK